MNFNIHKNADMYIHIGINITMNINTKNILHVFSYINICTGMNTNTFYMQNACICVGSLGRVQESSPEDPVEEALLSSTEKGVISSCDCARSFLGSQRASHGIIRYPLPYHAHPEMRSRQT